MLLVLSYWYLKYRKKPKYNVKQYYTKENIGILKINEQIAHNWYIMKNV